MSPAVTVPHRPDCPARLDRTMSRTGDGRNVTTVRCLDCGGVALLGGRERPLSPGSPEWAIAWVDDPARIGRTLTPRERFDPVKNPLHPSASSWPPDRPPTT